MPEGLGSGGGTVVLPVKKSLTDDTAANDTRSRLLETALKLFSEHGMEGMSLQMIADELGVTKAAVYYHFKTKDEIAEVVAAPTSQDLDQIIDEARTKRSQGAQIDHALAGRAGHRSRRVGSYGERLGLTRGVVEDGDAGALAARAAGGRAREVGRERARYGALFAERPVDVREEVRRVR